jgi:hypothetical protein
MDSSEKLIELGNSWYTAKTIEVERQTPDQRNIADIKSAEGLCFPKRSLPGITPKVQHWKKIHVGNHSC